MSPVQPPRWDKERLDKDRLIAIELFRDQRMAEPLEQYLEAFDRYRGVVEDLLETTVDLSELSDHAVAVLTDPDMLDAVRYLPGPPISKDDLKVLADASLTPSRLKGDAEMAERVIDTVLAGLDRNRFPWVAEDREPTNAEREAAALASAALIASRRVMTDRANESKVEQENAVKNRLIAMDFQEVPRRKIGTLADAPGAGGFCGETEFGNRRADLVVGLWDNRKMPVECKVSNSSTNSIKRLNNDAAVKASVWHSDFGTKGVVPSAVLAGVFKRRNLEEAQDRGLTLFWAHDLGALSDFIQSTKTS